MTDKNSIKIPPYQYIHVLDRNTNVTRLEIGPQTFIRQDHEKFVTGNNPVAMIVLPTRNYCEISDPIIIDKDGNIKYDKYGQVSLRHGEVEIRFSEGAYKQPFPLYPGENLKTKPTPLTVVKENTALRIEAIRNFEKDGKKLVAGDEWLFIGPGTYIPRTEERVVMLVNAVNIQEQKALKLKARQDFTDRTKVARKTGEEWLVRTPGSYLPEINELVVGIIEPYILTSQTAVQLRAARNFTDVYGVTRKAGEEWLITTQQSSYHLLDIFEEFVSLINVTVLRKNQYCYVNDPRDSDGKNRHGTKQLRFGEDCFFLQPGESLDGGIKNASILTEDQAILLKAQEAFKDEEGAERKPGDKWMVQGPRIYIPPTQVEIVEYRTRVPLDKNEGVYVRDTQTGIVRCEYGQSYLLKAQEEFWLKELTETEEQLIKKNINVQGWERDKRKVISFRCPFNHAVQIYDYRQKKSRVKLGPGLIYLEPDETFTVSSLSGSTPKKPGIVNTLSINLGPDFSTDVISVETSDHTRLNLKISFHWHFKIDPANEESLAKIFEVRDFVGNMCNQMASRVRTAVATCSFEEFHKNSARIIRKAVLGVDDKGKIKEECFFETNNLSITNVDIQSVIPADKITLENLQKAVTQAIEISTKSLEAQYKYQADMMEQQALGALEKTKIDFQSKAEEAKKKLMSVQAESQSIQNTGTAKAAAKARAEAAEIESQTKVKIATLRANARQIQMQAELDKRTSKQGIDIDHNRKISDLEINKAKELAKIDSEKVKSLIKAIDQDTLVAIANAGPAFQAELLKGLNLNGYIMTDGNNPVNLFNTAASLIGTGKTE